MALDQLELELPAVGQLLKGYWELHLGPLRSNSALNHQAAVSLVLSFWFCLFVLLFCFVFLIDLFIC